MDPCFTNKREEILLKNFRDEKKKTEKKNYKSTKYLKELKNFDKIIFSCINEKKGLINLQNKIKPLINKNRLKKKPSPP